MARLRDVPHVLRTVGLVGFVKKVYFEINDDNLFTWAASLAYSWLFAIFPFFVFLLTLIPLLKDDWQQEAVRRINIAVDVSVPKETGRAMHSHLDPRLDELPLNPPAGTPAILPLVLI